MIKFLILLFIIILLILAIFMLRHYKQPFILLNPKNLIAMQLLIKITAWLFLITSFAGLIILLVLPLEWNLLTLVVGSAIAGGFAVLAARLN